MGRRANGAWSRPTPGAFPDLCSASYKTYVKSLAIELIQIISLYHQFASSLEEKKIYGRATLTADIKNPQLRPFHRSVIYSYFCYFSGAQIGRATNFLFLACSSGFSVHLNGSTSQRRSYTTRPTAQSVWVRKEAEPRVLLVLSRYVFYPNRVRTKLRRTCIYR